jgi:hypothetical protein
MQIGKYLKRTCFYIWLYLSGRLRAAFLFVPLVLQGGLLTGYRVTNADLMVEAVKVSPAVPVPAMTLMGYGVADWASTATFVYVVMIGLHYVYKNFIKPLLDGE